MNALSWLIYAAGVLDGINIMLGIALGFSILAVCMSWTSRMLASAMVLDMDLPSDFKPKGSRDYQKWEAWESVTRRKSIYLIPVALMVVMAVLPSSRTLWLIAASEAGETVVTSPDAIEMLNDLKAVIKDRLKSELAD